MAIFPHSYVQGGRAAHPQTMRAEQQAQPQPQSGPNYGTQSCDSASPVLSTLQKLILSVGKVP
jgi:hypothetical protein